MKLICDRSALLGAVNLVSGVVASHTPKPQLTCIHLSAQKADDGGRLILSGTDAEISIRLMRTQVEVHEDGEVLVPADRLRAIISAEDSDPTLTIEAIDDVCHIRGRDAKFKIFGYPAGDFPNIPEFPQDDSAADVFTIGSDLLSRLIARTIFSTARENSRYAINGVLMHRKGKKVEMVATDGRRLALARGNADTPGSDEDSQCIIPTKALSLAGKIIDDPQGKVRIAITTNQILFAFDDAGGDSAVLASNLVEGTFPPYDDVIPKDQDKRATFDTSVLSSAVKRAAILTTEDSRGVRLAFSKSDGADSLKMSSRTPESGEAEIDVDLAGYEGDEIEIGFNPAFITDALKVVPDNQVILELKSSNKPGLIKSGSDFLYVVMPVNLQ